MVKGKEKEIIVDESVRDAFIYENTEAAVGLLVGAYTETADFCVAHLAQTLEEEPCEYESQSSSDEDYELPQLRGRSFTVLQPSTLAHHAKQVIRMLPGGFIILGIYVVEPVENIFTAKYENAIKHLLASLSKSLSKNPYYASSCGNTEDRIVFHFNPTTKKFTCKIVDNISFKTQKLETSFSRLEWSKLECDYDTTLAMHLSKPESGVLLKKNLRILMNTFHGKLESAKFFISGKLPSEETTYEEPQIPVPEIELGLSDFEGDGGGNGDRDRDDGPDVPILQDSDSGNDSDSELPKMDCAVHILIDEAYGAPSGNTVAEDFVDHINLQGKISAVAFVHVGSSTSFVIKMLKQDIIRSMASRIEMHCDSLIEEEQTSVPGEGEASKVFHELPHRVFARLPGSKVLVSDYLFPGEGPRDAVITFQDILSLRLEDEADVLVGKEKPFNLDELRTRVSVEELLAKADSIVKLAPGIKGGNAMIWLVITTIIIVIFAVIVPNLFPRMFEDDPPTGAE